MIVEYIRYSVVNKNPGLLLEAYRNAIPFLAAAPECLGLEVSQCSEDATSIVVRILWTSVDGHIEGFRKGPNFPPFLVEIRPFIASIAEMRHYDLMDIGFTR